MSSSKVVRGAVVALVILLVGCSPAPPSPATPSARTPALALTRAISPASPIAPNSVVSVALDLRVTGPGRDGTVEVVDIVPSGLAALDGAPGERTRCGIYDVGPARVEGQRVLFVVSFRSVERNEDGDVNPVVPGTFCLGYLARVVTAGSYAWQPAVARQATSPGLVATTPAGTVELR